MASIFSRPVGVSDPQVANYWDYFGGRLVERTDIYPGARLLDVACGTGSSLFPAAEKTGPRGFAVGIDICPH